MTFRWGLVGFCLLVSASGPSANPTAQVSRGPLSCADALLQVTVQGSEVRAVNAGRRECALAGRHRVELPWWRTVGAEPVPAHGTLPPGGALVQAYRMEGGNGCPSPGRSDGTDIISVSVEGVTHRLSLPTQTVFEITTCDMASALPPTVELPPR